MSSTAKLHGDLLAYTRQRARLDPDAPDYKGSFLNVGPDPVEHIPAGAKGAKPATVQPGEKSKPITDHRWLRSLGESNIACDACRVEGVI